MGGAILAVGGRAALAGHAASQHLAQPLASQRWAATGIPPDSVYWFALVNVVLLAVLFAVSIQRYRPPEHRGVRGDGLRGGGLATGNRPKPTGALPLPPLRASDAERDATATVLARAVAAGRLTLDEGVERMDLAYRARDRSELEAVTADLPCEPPEDAGNARTRWR